MATISPPIHQFEEKKSVGKKIKYLLLGETANSAEEIKLVRKLDFFILTYCCLSFFFNYLDRAAFANAYVDGLKTSLGLSANQYSYLLSITTAGYVIGQIPHGIIIQKIAPRIWMPSMVVCWAGLVMCSAACKTYSQLMAVRFFQGLVEASTYSGTLYIIGSWYKPYEIAKRTAIFTASGQAGTMFAGVMMTAIHKGMNEYAGLSGWQWVFIIDGIISLPIAIMGFLYFPDTPELTKAPFLGAKERKLALDRLPPKKADAHNIEFWSLTRRVFTSPAFYILIFFSIISGALETFCVQNLMLLWMKYNSSKFSDIAITTYPLGVSGVAIVANLSSSVYIDATGNRVLTGFIAGGLQLISAILLLTPNLPTAATFFAFYNAGTSYIVNPLLFGWANVICQRGGDDALRSIILYSMTASSNILFTFWGIALYPATDAPYWKKGAIAMIVIIACMMAMIFVVAWLDRYTAKIEKESAVVTESRSEVYDEIDKNDMDKEKGLIDKGAVSNVSGARPIIMN